jgi:Ni/Co efflux regulator RcnB
MISGPGRCGVKSRKGICLLVAMIVAFSGLAAFAQGQGNGRGRQEREDRGERGHGRETKEHGRKKKRDTYYSDQNREWARTWYRDHHGDLPPGLAKRDELPPGLARQLRVRGTLPPGLQKKIHPVPEAFVSHLPPPPPDCEHVLIGGNIVLMNRKTHLVLDIVALFH